MKKSHRRRNIAIVLVAVVLLFILGLALLAPANNVVITSDNTNIHIEVSVCNSANLCQTKTISVVKTNSSTFTTRQGDTFYDYTYLPFSDLESLKTSCKSFTVTITQDSLETPDFTVQSQSPSVPITFQNAANDVTITSVVQAPNHAYTGGLEWSLSGTVACTVP